MRSTWLGRSLSVSVCVDVWGLFVFVCRYFYFSLNWLDFGIGNLYLTELQLTNESLRNAFVIFNLCLAKCKNFKLFSFFDISKHKCRLIFLSFSCCGERHRWDITLYWQSVCLCLHKTQYKYFVLLLYLLWMTSFAWWVETAIRKGISINFNAHCTSIWVIIYTYWCFIVSHLKLITLCSKTIHHINI